MGGLENTGKRLFNLGIGKGYKTNTERKQEKEAKAQAHLDKIYSDVPIPDAEEIKRNERRKAAKRQGSRAATVLTERDTLG
jgi:hypothetical protein